MKRVSHKEPINAKPRESRWADFLVENVLDYFNDREVDDSDKTKRLIRELIENLKILVSPASAAKLKGNNRVVPDDLLLVIDRVNKVLDRYAATPIVMWNSAYGGVTFGDDFRQAKKGEEYAAGVAYSVKDLAEIGQLDRVRACICGKWFFARTKTQSSCSSRCRHMLYERTPESKEKRRKYMRDYRKREREEEERAKQSAKVKGR